MSTINDKTEWVKYNNELKRIVRDIYISKCGNYFKKSCNNPEWIAHLLREILALKTCEQLKLSKIQQLVEWDIDIKKGSYFITKNAGVPLLKNIKKIPKNWLNQLTAIDNQLLELNRYKIYHNDVKPKNICLKDNKLTLIDFNYCTFGVPYYLGTITQDGVTLPGPVVNNCYMINTYLNERTKNI